MSRPSARAASVLEFALACALGACSPAGPTPQRPEGATDSASVAPPSVPESPGTAPVIVDAGITDGAAPEAQDLDAGGEADDAGRVEDRLASTVARISTALGDAGTLEGKGGVGQLSTFAQELAAGLDAVSDYGEPTSPGAQGQVGPLPAQGQSWDGLIAQLRTQNARFTQQGKDLLKTGEELEASRIRALEGLSGVIRFECGLPKPRPASVVLIDYIRAVMDADPLLELNAVGGGADDTVYANASGNTNETLMERRASAFRAMLAQPQVIEGRTVVRAIPKKRVHLSPSGTTSCPACKATCAGCTSTVPVDDNCQCRTVCFTVSRGK